MMMMTMIMIMIMMMICQSHSLFIRDEELFYVMIILPMGVSHMVQLRGWTIVSVLCLHVSMLPILRSGMI